MEHISEPQASENGAFQKMGTDTLQPEPHTRRFKT